MSKKKAFVIGGTSSIGLEIAAKLKEQGALVTVAGRHKPTEEKKYDCFVSFDFDREKFNIFDRDEFTQNLLDCDILINCYGPFLYKKLHETSVEDWIYISNADYAFAGSCLSFTLRGMMKRKWGRIILFGGTRTDSVKGYRNNACYAGAKTGIAVLVKSVSLEYGEMGICCNGIFPGFTRNAPKNTLLIAESKIADNVINILKQDELNGLLFTMDRGWNPVL